MCWVGFSILLPVLPFLLLSFLGFMFLPSPHIPFPPVLSPRLLSSLALPFPAYPYFPSPPLKFEISDIWPSCQFCGNFGGGCLRFLVAVVVEDDAADSVSTVQFLNHKDDHECYM